MTLHWHHLRNTCSSRARTEHCFTAFGGFGVVGFVYIIDDFLFERSLLLYYCVKNNAFHTLHPYVAKIVLRNKAVYQLLVMLSFLKVLNYFCS